jgi:hypothetical protein
VREVEENGSKELGLAPLPKRLEELRIGIEEEGRSLGGNGAFSGWSLKEELSMTCLEDLSIPIHLHQDSEFRSKLSPFCRWDQTIHFDKLNAACGKFNYHKRC